MIQIRIKEADLSSSVGIICSVNNLVNVKALAQSVKT